MPPKQKRGKSNKWKPNKDDRLRIVQQIAHGMTIDHVGIEHGVSANTLRKYCAAEIAEGKAMNKGIFISRLHKLAIQDANLPTALNATRFALGAFHNIREEGGNGDPEDAVEEQNAALSSAKAKLAPYLAISDRVAAAQDALEVDGGRWR